MFWLHRDVATLDQPGMLLLTYIIILRYKYAIRKGRIKEQTFEWNETLEISPVIRLYSPQSLPLLN